MADGVYTLPSASLSSFTVQHRECVFVGVWTCKCVLVCMISKHFLPSGYRGHVPRDVGLLLVSFNPDVHGNPVNLNIGLSKQI